jgi:hypothetical protein
MAYEVTRWCFIVCLCRRQHEPNGQRHQDSQRERPAATPCGIAGDWYQLVNG